MKNDTKYILRQNRPADTQAMFEIWEEAVKATHHFLSQNDIVAIGQQVKDYLANATFLVATDKTHTLLGFMGMTENKIDSLFVHPHYFGKGLGTLFIQYAESHHQVLYVDVNEDNNQAKVFYERMGFKILVRSELDDEGRPFPILKMIRS